ncbi:MAG: universal stress protein [Ktedonobacterales bacterium]|nr:universal stress protein [Ktedonobacterales bacterium]
MHILVPLDGSPLAERAIEPAVMLLRRLSSPGSLTLLRVVNPSSITYDISGLAPPISESVFQAAIEGGLDYLAQVATRRPMHGIRVATTAEIGSGVATTICQVANDLAVDFIMMASHTRTGVPHFILGSVAEAVMRESTVPTLIIHREGASFPAQDRDEPLTILVPLDGTPMAESALAPAMGLAKQVRGAIRVLRVLPPHQGSTPTDRMLVDETQAYFARVRALGEAQGITMQESIAWGEVAPSIAAIAQEFQTDLVTIATHGRTGLAQMRDGSITLGVLHHLVTPMMVVHPPAEVVQAPAPIHMAHVEP